MTPHEFITSSKKKIGLIAGGQLGKMLGLAASNFGIEVSVMDGSENAPARAIAKNFTLGSYNVFDDVVNFGSRYDCLILELEHVDIDALRVLEEKGVDIIPPSKVLSIIQDKGKQKLFFQKNGFASSQFKLIENKEDLNTKIDVGEISFPFIQKSRTHGYDGKGVVKINAKKDLVKAFDVQSVIEEFVEIKNELSVITYRSREGEVGYFEPVEMIFDANEHLVDMLISPSSISDDLKQKAIHIACSLIETLDFYGLLAVEFFITHDDEILVNEVAPRPHNSGHHTIEAHLCSQFEQLIRIAVGLPLGSSEQIHASVLLNLVGDKHSKGKVFYENIDDCFKIKGAKFHIYGKTTTKPFRKMGHVTILDKDINKAITKAKQIKQTLKICTNETA